VTDREQQEFEAELRRTRLVKLPEELRSRLLAAAPPKKARSAPPWPALAVLGWLRVLRLALPAAAVVLLAAVILWRNASPLKPKAIKSTSKSGMVASTPLKADEVKIDQELVSSFDAVARLPGGEPVRFRCNQWLDEITLSNKAQGLVFQERSPRLEIVPVGFETY
jgi:hypothetical protein